MSERTITRGRDLHTLPTRVRKCCNPIGPCSGSMAVYQHAPICPVWRDGKCECWVQEEVFVSAHHQPVFTQCGECGYAPFPFSSSKRRTVVAKRRK